MVLALIPLGFMMVREICVGRVKELPRWKGSLLPLLSRGLSKPPADVGSTPMTAEDLEKPAKETVVEFSVEDGQFKLSAADKDV